MKSDALKSLRRSVITAMGLRQAWVDGFWKGTLAGIASGALLTLLLRAARRRAVDFDDVPYRAV